MTLDDGSESTSGTEALAFSWWELLGKDIILQRSIPLKKCYKFQFLFVVSMITTMRNGSKVREQRDEDNNKGY
jgi:hypothetical protein